MINNNIPEIKKRLSCPPLDENDSLQDDELSKLKGYINTINAFKSFLLNHDAHSLYLQIQNCNGDYGLEHLFNFDEILFDKDNFLKFLENEVELKQKQFYAKMGGIADEILSDRLKCIKSSIENATFGDMGD